MQVEILLDSSNPYNDTRLTTFHLYYPQNIHQHILTHRVFSRNSMSLRAMSHKRVSELSLSEKTWTLEKKGMQGQIAPDDIVALADAYTLQMYSEVKKWCNNLHAIGIHHQDINDYLRPFSNIHTILTGTDFDNFFKLRLGEQAKPDIKKLAQLMLNAMEESKPKHRFSHIPAFKDDRYSTENSCLISAARLARYSYMQFGGEIEDDLKLAGKLIADKHASPFEHQAFAQVEDSYYKNFKSWKQYREVIGL